MTVAAIYARKSTEQNGTAETEKSVTRQVESARAYAERKGWTVDGHIYVDDAVSGAEFSNRPAFVRMMDTLKPRPPFQRLVIMDESRLGREQVEVSYVIKQFIQAGVEVWCYMEDRQRTMDGPMDKLLMAFTAAADELEREKARQRVTDAMVRKAKKGHVTGGRCFGYDNVDVVGPDGTRSHVERRINEEEAATVRKIFELCAEGYGKTRIAHMLNDEGAPSPRAQQGRPKGWAPSSVRAVLYRNLYRGRIVWNKSRKRDSWGRRDQKARPESEWIEVEAPELRIVDDSLWEHAHKRLAATRATYLRHQDGRVWGKPPTGVSGKYLLTGLARCGKCGAGLEVRSRSHGKRRAKFYACSAYYRKGRAVCECGGEIPMKAADAAIVDSILTNLLTPDRLRSVADRAVELAKRERDGDEAQRPQLERQLRDAEKSVERLVGAIEAGADVEPLVQRLRDAESRREALEKRLAALDTPPPTVDAVTEKRLRKAVEEWREILGRQVPVARQIVGKLLAEKIRFTPEERDGEKGWRFEGEGTFERLLGSVPGVSQAVVSPTGFEPVLPA